MSASLCVVRSAARSRNPKSLGRLISECPVDESNKNRWRVVSPSGNLDGFKESDFLVALLRLARVVNAFRFLHVSLSDFSGVEDSPSHSRQRFQSFLFSCGLLHEAVRVFEGCGKELRDVPAFRERLVPLMRSDRVKRLTAQELGTIRNRIAFHFDEDVLRLGLERYSGTDHSFLESWGRAAGDIYFGLADSLSIGYVLDEQHPPPDGERPELDRFRSLLEDVTAFQLEFCVVAEAVIAQGLIELGWVRENDDSPAESS